MSSLKPGSVLAYRPNKRMPSVKETFSPGAFSRGPIGEGIREKLGLRKEKPAIESPPPPTIEDAEGRAQDEADRIRRRKGRASAILTDKSTLGQPTTASVQLLGR